MRKLALEVMAIRSQAVSRWLLGGASVAFGTVFAMSAVQPVAGATYAQDAAVQAGLDVIQQHNCGGCHVIPGVPGARGKFGPDLGPNADLPPLASRDMIASGTVPNGSPDDLAAWIVNPPSLKPGTTMPRLGLSDDEAAAAAAYLWAIQPDGSITGLDDSDDSGD
jgi:cytochrome c1